MKIGFVGTGVITEAIVTGLLKAQFSTDGIIVSPRSQATSRKLTGLSSLVSVAKNNQEVVSSSDIVFLAVRPQVAEEVVRPLSFAPGTVVASLIATVPIPTLRQWIDVDVEISRAIPLPFVSDLEGVTAVYPGSGVLGRIFGAIGTVVDCETIDEFDAFGVASALMGTYFGFAEASAQWLKVVGVPYDKSRAYLASFFHGLSGAALAAPSRSFEELRIGHSTVGGLNEQLYECFRQGGGLKALTTALDAVSDRLDGAREA